MKRDDSNNSQQDRDEAMLARPLLSADEFTAAAYKAYASANPPTDATSQRRNWEALQHKIKETQRQKKKTRLSYVGLGVGLAAACLLTTLYQPSFDKTQDYTGIKGSVTYVPVTLHALVQDQTKELREVSSTAVAEGGAGESYYFAVSSLQPAFIVMATFDQSEHLELTTYRFDLEAGERKLVAVNDEALVYEWQGDDHIVGLCALGLPAADAAASLTEAGLQRHALPPSSCIRFKGK